MKTTSYNYKENLENLYKKIKKTLEKKLHLTISPSLILKINQALKEDISDLKELSREIENYPTVALKLLKIANSPFFGFPRKVSTIYHALLVIGVKGVKLIILSLLGGEVLKKNREIFLHSLRTSFACRWLNEKLEFNLNDWEIDEVAIGGLLHDIGKVLLELTFGEEYLKIRKKIVQLRGECINSSIQLEKEFLGVDHAELGAKLLEDWNFPDILISLVANHHQPLAENNVDQRKLILLFLGNLISNFYSEYEKDCIEKLLNLPEIKTVLDKLDPKHIKHFTQVNFLQFLHEFNIYLITCSSYSSSMA